MGNCLCGLVNNNETLIWVIIAVLIILSLSCGNPCGCGNSCGGCGGCGAVPSYNGGCGCN